jgi:chorismate-pyruvate lyase
MLSQPSVELLPSADQNVLERALEALFPVYEGSLSQLLAICCGSPIQVQVLLHWSAVLKEPVPALGLSVGERAIDRRVLLRHGSSGRPLAFVTSVVAPDRLPLPVQQRLLDRVRPQPLGRLLHERELPAWRRITSSTHIPAGAHAVPSFGGTSTHRRMVLLALEQGPVLLSQQTVACRGGCRVAEILAPPCGEECL